MSPPSLWRRLRIPAPACPNAPATITVASWRTPLKLWPLHFSESPQAITIAAAISKAATWCHVTAYYVRPPSSSLRVEGGFPPVHIDANACRTGGAHQDLIAHEKSFVVAQDNGVPDEIFGSQ